MAFLTCRRPRGRGFREACSSQRPQGRALDLETTGAGAWLTSKDARNHRSGHRFATFGQQNSGAIGSIGPRSAKPSLIGDERRPDPSGAGPGTCRPEVRRVRPKRGRRNGFRNETRASSSKEVVTRFAAQAPSASRRRGVRRCRARRALNPVQGVGEREGSSREPAVRRARVQCLADGRIETCPPPRSLATVVPARRGHGDRTGLRRRAASGTSASRQRSSRRLRAGRPSRIDRHGRNRPRSSRDHEPKARDRAFPRCRRACESAVARTRGQSARLIIPAPRANEREPFGLLRMIRRAPGLSGPKEPRRRDMTGWSLARSRRKSRNSKVTNERSPRHASADAAPRSGRLSRARIRWRERTRRRRGNRDFGGWGRALERWFFVGRSRSAQSRASDGQGARGSCSVAGTESHERSQWPCRFVLQRCRFVLRSTRLR
jgi:hypothetical protein